MKCSKKLIYQQFVQASGLCGPQYWCTVLVHQYGHLKSTKTSGVHVFYKRSKLRITILKYHLWYLCQISLQIMLLPIPISLTSL